MNATGLVVGYQLVDSVQPPIVWRADQYSSSSTPNIPRVLLGNGVSGEARGINSPSSGNPTVVGWTYVGSFPVYTGFKHVFGSDAATTLTSLSPLSGDEDSKAFDVSVPAGSGSAAWVAGVSGDIFVGQSCVDAAGNDTARWELTTSLPVEGLREDFLPASSPLDLELWDGAANAVNTQKQAAGAFRFDANSGTPVDCKKHPGFWNADGTAVDLWADQMTSFPNNDSEAFGMTDADSSGGGLLVTGWDISAVEAMLWWKESTPSSPGSATFASRRADSLCFIGNGTRWVLDEFQDVNTQGWLVGQGFVDTGMTVEQIRKHAFLMVPIAAVPNCVADLNADFAVDATDLAILIGAWTPSGGSCGGCCYPDLNDDSQVNAADLAILLGAWGTVCDTAYLAETSCTAGCLPPGESQEQAGMVAGSAEPESSGSIGGEVLAAIGAFGFQSIPEFEDWLASLPIEQQLGVAMTIESILAGGAS